MEDNKISISLLPNEYLMIDKAAIVKKIKDASCKDDVSVEDIEYLARVLSGVQVSGELDDYIFDLDRALDICGKIGGVCYNPEGFDKLYHEDPEKTQKRIDMTINNGHHSVYDHIFISFNMRNIPKILAMVLNNEKQYTTSEKSARYTKVASQSGASITKEEQELYNKWVDIFKIKIKEKYGYQFNDRKIEKLAQENARYLVTVFMPTTFIYTTSLRQINNLAAFMKDYIANANQNDKFQVRLADSMKEVLHELSRVNVLDSRLMTNNKERKFSLFGKDLANKNEYFGDVYSTNYKASFAELAQAQRHRTLDYQMERLDDKEFFVPPIIEDDDLLSQEWLRDIKSVSGLAPQGEKVLVNESGKYDDFKLKLKERLCSAAQLEINNQTKETLTKYRDALVAANHPLKDDIEKYTHGARCTFPDFTCTEDCHFAEGKRLIRKI